MMGTWGNRVQGYGVEGMGIWGNRVQGYGVQDTWAIGTLSMWATWGNRVQGYGVQDIWVMGTGVWGILGHVYDPTLTPSH